MISLNPNLDHVQQFSAISSLSYSSITTKEEIGVSVETLMGEGLHLLFMNEKSDYAFFERYDDIVGKPIAVYEV